MKDLKSWCKQHHYDLLDAESKLSLITTGFGNRHVQVTPNIANFLHSKLTKIKSPTYTEVRCTECDTVIGYSHEWEEGQRKRCAADWNM